MYNDPYTRPAPSEPNEWAFNRFLRGFVGAMPVPICLGAFVYAFELIDLADTYSIGALIAALLIIPIVIAVRAMQLMPIGDEAGFLRDRIMPKLGDGLRGIVLLCVLVAVWAFSAFVLLGALGMIISGVRRMFS